MNIEMKKETLNLSENKAMQYEPVLCGVIVDNTEDFYNDSIACNRKAKYKVKYRKGTTGEFTEKYVCGLHFRQLEKIHFSLKNKTGYDNEFSYVEINPT